MVTKGFKSEPSKMSAILVRAVSPTYISKVPNSAAIASASDGTSEEHGDRPVVTASSQSWESVLNKWRSVLLVDHGLNKSYLTEKERDGIALLSDPAPSGNVSVYQGRKWMNDAHSVRRRKNFEIYRNKPTGEEYDDSVITTKVPALKNVESNNKKSSSDKTIHDNNKTCEGGALKRDGESDVSHELAIIIDGDSGYGDTTVGDGDLISTRDSTSLSLSLFEQSLALPFPNYGRREQVKPRPKLHLKRTVHIPQRNFSRETHTFCGYRRIPDEVWKNYFEQRSVLTDVYSNVKCVDKKDIMAQVNRESDHQSLQALEDGTDKGDLKLHSYDCTGREDAGDNTTAIDYKKTVVPPPEAKVEVLIPEDIRNLDVEYGIVPDQEHEGKPTVGFMCKFQVIVNPATFNFKENNELVEVYIECRTPEDDKEFAFVRSCSASNAVLRCEFYPQSIGDYVIKISPLKLNGYQGDVHVIEVFDNLPLLSFNDGEYWPVAIAVDEKWYKKKISVYVAYSHHVTEFTDDGEKIRRLTKLQDGYYNDLAVGSKNYVLAASISGLNGMRAHTYRFQCVHVYHLMSGRLMYKIGDDFPFFRFETPIVNLATKGDDHIVLVDRARVCEVNIHTGDMKSRLDLEKPGAVSGLCCYGDKYYITDAADGFIKVYNDIGLLQAQIPVFDAAGENARGLVGVRVDTSGLILVADCVSGVIRVFNQGGALLRNIESRTGGVQWPLDLDVTSAGHVFVVDHGNVCVKKFRYV